MNYSDGNESGHHQTHSDTDQFVNHSPRPSMNWSEKLKDPVTIFTFLLVLVGALQGFVLYKTDNTLRIQQRAWVEFDGARLPFSPQKDKGIKFQLFYSNSGNEPALSANITFDTSVIDSFEPQFTDMRDIKVSENTSCLRTNPVPGQAVYSPTKSGIVQAINEDTLHGSPQYLADDKFLNGEKFLVINGCVAYITLNEVHRSSFCYIVEKSTPIIVDAMTGSQIPLPEAFRNAAQRSFNVENCAHGFEAD